MNAFLRRFGLHQRILGLILGGALVTAGVVGWSLYEIALLQGFIEKERAAEQRSEEINKAVTFAYRAAANFAALGLDLDPAEKQKHFADGEDMLRKFQSVLAVIRPVLEDHITEDELKTLDGFTDYIAHSWE